MTRILLIIAALALGVFAFSNVFSLAVPSSSSAYECRFGTTPADFDAEWQRWGTEVLRATKRGKWVVVEVVATPEQ